jgi:hypothetical protein
MMNLRGVSSAFFRRGHESPTELNLKRTLAECRRELKEALEQQAATSEVLRVISSSPSELNPVLNSILENATRICEAKFGNLFRFHLTARGAVDWHGWTTGLPTVARKPRSTDRSSSRKSVMCPFWCSTRNLRRGIGCGQLCVQS